MTHLCGTTPARLEPGEGQNWNKLYRDCKPPRPVASSARFENGLSRIKAPGEGCHSSLLTVANYAALDGINPGEAAHRIYESIPQGKRRVAFREVAVAVEKAYKDREGHRHAYVPPRSPAPPKIDAQAVYGRCLAAHPDPIHELIEKSYTRLLGDIDDDAVLLLETHFQPDDLVPIGPITGNKTIKPAREWIEYRRAGGILGSHIGMNPVSGKLAQKKDGGLSMHCDAAVTEHRFILLESDTIPQATQAAIWLSFPMPLACVINSAGSSLHAWLKVDNDIDRQRIKRLFVPLGFDGACFNPCRMSRTPGILRTDKIEPGVLPKDNFQRLLYLDPDARGVAA